MKMLPRGLYQKARTFSRTNLILYHGGKNGVHFLAPYGWGVNFNFHGDTSNAAKIIPYTWQRPVLL
jgi:hypothetical protein